MCDRLAARGCFAWRYHDRKRAGAGLVRSTFIRHQSVVTVKHFDIDHLHEQRADLEREARTGRLAVISSEEGPVCVAVPFDDLLLKFGVNLDLAVKLFDEEVISLGKASQLAGIPLAAFMDHLRTLGIPVARPAPGELEQELARFG